MTLHHRMDNLGSRSWSPWVLLGHKPLSRSHWILECLGSLAGWFGWRILDVFCLFGLSFSGGLMAFGVFGCVFVGVFDRIWGLLDRRSCKSGCAELGSSDGLWHSFLGSFERFSDFFAVNGCVLRPKVWLSLRGISKPGERLGGSRGRNRWSSRYIE